MPLLPQQDIVQNLGITQTVTPSITHRLPSGIVQILPISDRVTAVIIPAPNKLGVSSGVTVGQTLSFSIVKPIRSTVLVSQSIGRQIIRTRTLTQILPINQYVNAWIDKGVSGNDGSIYVNPIVAAYEASLTPPAEVTFTCVNADAIPDPINTSITIRKPEFGDATNLEQYRVQRLTLGGTLEIYKDSMWPDTERISISFDYLTEEKATELLHFLTITLGQIMSFRDQFGNLFTGYILTPFESILQPKRVGWSAAFTFQKFEDPNPVN